MITAVFNDKMDYTIAYGLWQWDYGQVLRIQGLDFNQISIEVHFSLSPDNTESLVAIGVVKDVDYQSTIVSDGEEYVIDETKTVLDVLIPKNMLWNNIKKDYTIYAFITSTNEESGETLKKIIIPVKAKPKPMYSVTPEDEELFHSTVEEVNKFANIAKENSTLAKSYAVGGTETRENEDVDNAKYYAEQSALSAEASAQSASDALVSENNALDSANSALGSEERARNYATEAKGLKEEYDSNLALAKEYRDSAQSSAVSASANLQATITARNIATQASADANNFLNETRDVYNLAVEVKQEVDETKADVDTTKAEVEAVKTDIDAVKVDIDETKSDINATRTEIAETRSEVNTAKTEVNTIKSEVEDIKAEIDEDKVSIDGIKTTIDNQASTIADNLAQSNQIKTDVIQLKNDTASIKNETSGIKDETNQLKTDVIELIDGFDNTVDEKISEHNNSSIAHSDIRGLISTLAERLNAFLDTDEESLDQISELISFIQNNRTLIEGITTDKADKSEIPTKTSELTNDSGYLTEHQDISGKADRSEILTPLIGNAEDITPQQVMECLEEGRDVSVSKEYEFDGTNFNLTFTAWNRVTDVVYEGQYADLVISNTIATFNGAYYLFEMVGGTFNNEMPWSIVSQMIVTPKDLTANYYNKNDIDDIVSSKANKSEIPTVPTNVSAFTNDSGYINDLSSYIYYSQNSNTVYINSATEITDADEASF